MTKNSIRNYRGYSRELKEWFYGSYVDGHIINGVFESNSEWITIEYWMPVDRESVGQYTGLEDIDGKKLYEGDLVNVYDSFSDRYFAGVVKFDNGSFCIVDDVSSNYRLLDYSIKFAAKEYTELSKKSLTAAQYKLVDAANLSQ